MQRSRWGIPLLFLLFSVVVLGPIFRDLAAFPANVYDWRYFAAWVEAGRRSIVWYRQFPLWNPWTCGGQVYLANPQSLTAAPTFLLPVLLGTALGMKAMLLFFLYCSFDGMYRLARSYALSPAAALLSSILFGTSGWFALHLLQGHFTFAGALLFPYLALFYRKALSDLRFAVALGAVAAFIAAHGGTSTPAIAAVLLLTLGASDAIALRSLRPLAILLFGGMAALLLGAIRLLPALEFAIDHPRHIRETDTVQLLDLVRFGFEWKGAERVPGHHYYFHEYGWKMPFLAAPLFVWSLVPKNTRRLWMIVLVGAAIAIGNAWPHGPWSWMRQLPVFSDLRVPSRYSILLVFALSLLGGAALDDLRGRLRPSWRDLWVAILVAGCAVEGLAFDWLRYAPIFHTRMTIADRGAPFFQTKDDWRRMLDHVLANQGAIVCDEEAPLERARALRIGAEPQVQLAELDAGRIDRIFWTPNLVAVEVELVRPTRVLFNQNWNEHWKASIGQVVKEGPKWPYDQDGGQLAVQAPAGRYRLEVCYRPRSFVVGGLITLVALSMSLLLWWSALRRRQATQLQVKEQP